MTKRIKTQAAPEIESRAEMEALIAEIARLEIKRRDAANSMDAELQRVRDYYEPALNGLEAEIEAKMKVAAAWANANRAEFAERRTLATATAEFGFRLGNPKVAKLRGWTWERVLEAAQAAKSRWIRTKVELDKEKILAEHRVGDRIEAIGVEIIQDETFFVEPKLQPAEKRITDEA